MTTKEWFAELSTFIIALVIVGTVCGIVVAEALQGKSAGQITLPAFLDTALGFVIAFFFNRQATAQVVQLANGKLDTILASLPPPAKAA